jgi:LPS-assembly protein
MPEATRVHFEPTINLPLSNGWGSLNTEAKLLATHYQQSNLDDYNANGTDYKESVNRVMPQFKVDGKMVFRARYAGGVTQTLEPRMQYLYVPYRDQSKSATTTPLLQSDYSGLFRDRTYSGLDRIASANQVTTGVTSRVYDAAAVERFNVSVGQIYYFTESRTGDDNINWEKDNKTGSLVWAGDTYWRMTDVGVYAGVQYDTRLDNVATGNGTIEYRRDEDRLVQLNYRYASPEYIQATLPSIPPQQQ